MIREPMKEDESPQEAVNTELMTDLRRLYGRDVPVPPAVDEAILGAARARIVRRRRAWIVLRRVSIAATAAAAAVGLAVWIGQSGRRAARMSESMVAAVTAAGPKDIDRNGRVDILDAFMLARHLEKRGQKPFTDRIDGDALTDSVQKKASDPFMTGAENKRDRFVFQEQGLPRKTDLSRFSRDWDFNGDGVVDKGDVDVVALAAVSLKGGAS